MSIWKRMPVCVLVCLCAAAFSSRSANGKSLGLEPLKVFGQQIEVSEQTGELKLQITRSGESTEITIPLRKLGAFGEKFE